MPAATSRVARFDEEIAIVVERYDRVRLGNEIVRVHQEDMSQALAVSPTRKYQNEGGPSVAAIVELLRTHSSERADDIETFIDAIGFNWLIAGTDAHAKNYSLLSSAGPRVRLAPLYDVASILPYDGFDMRKIKLSIKVGGEYRLQDVGARQWRKLAKEVRIDEGRLIDRLVAMAGQVSVNRRSASGIAARACNPALVQLMGDRPRALAPVKSPNIPRMTSASSGAISRSPVVGMRSWPIARTIR